MIGRIKELWERYTDHVLHVAEIFLAAVIFFGLGVLYVERIIYARPPIAVAKLENGYVPAIPLKLADRENVSRQPQQQVVAKGEYVASRYGKTYYRVSCTNQIKEENKIFFSTEEDAKKAGLVLAKNCTQ